jgi:hypothetical protein
MAEQREMDCQPKPVFIAAAGADQVQIRRQKQIMAYQAIRVCRDIEEVCASTGRKQRSTGHRRPQNGVEVFWTRFNMKTIK